MLSWEHENNMNTYEVFSTEGCVMTDPNGEWTNQSMKMETNTVVENLTPNTAYTFAVRAVCSSNDPETSAFLNMCGTTSKYYSRATFRKNVCLVLSSLQQFLTLMFTFIV